MIKTGRKYVFYKLKGRNFIWLLYPSHPRNSMALEKPQFFANSLTGFPGQIGNYYPKDKFLISILLLRWVPPYLFSPSTISQVPMGFTHGDSNKGSHKEYMKETMTLCPIFFPPRKIMPNSRKCMPSSWFWCTLKNHLDYIQKASAT